MSAGYAAWKGFLSETLTIFDWLASAFGCLYFLGSLFGADGARHCFDRMAGEPAGLCRGLPDYLHSALHHEPSLLGERKAVRPIGPLDRALGIAFGVVRGLAVVAPWSISPTAISCRCRGSLRATQVKSARTLPMIQSTGDGDPVAGAGPCQQATFSPVRLRRRRVRTFGRRHRRPDPGQFWTPRPPTCLNLGGARKSSGANQPCRKSRQKGHMAPPTAGRTLDNLLAKRQRKLADDRHGFRT